jgi:flagella basal body P-ring formation protein FlgA
MPVRPLAPFLVSLALAYLALALPSSTLRAETVPVRAAEARASVLADLATQLAAHFRAEGELQLESVRPFTVALDPEGRVPAIEVLEFPQLLSPAMIVRARLGSAEHTLVLRVQLLRDVWVARTPLERATPFASASLDTRRVDTLRERDAVPADEACRDFDFVRSVPANRILTWRDVARRALVRKGQVIEVAAIDGPLAVMMKALAMESGAAGETVKVRNLDSKKEFNALVVADARAQVRF